MNRVHGDHVVKHRSIERTERQNQQAVAGVGDGVMQRPRLPSLGHRRPEPEESASHLPVDGGNNLELLPFQTLRIGFSLRPLLRSHDNALAATCTVLSFFPTMHASSLS